MCLVQCDLLWIKWNPSLLHSENSNVCVLVNLEHSLNSVFMRFRMYCNVKNSRCVLSSLKLIFKVFINPFLFIYKTEDTSDFFYTIYGYEVAYCFPSGICHSVKSGLVMLRINCLFLCGNFLKLFPRRFFKKIIKRFHLKCSMGNIVDNIVIAMYAVRWVLVIPEDHFVNYMIV